MLLQDRVWNFKYFLTECVFQCGRTPLDRVVANAPEWTHMNKSVNQEGNYLKVSESNILIASSVPFTIHKFSSTIQFFLFFLCPYLSSLFVFFFFSHFRSKLSLRNDAHINDLNVRSSNHIKVVCLSWLNLKHIIQSGYLMHNILVYNYIYS